MCVHSLCAGIFSHSSFPSLYKYLSISASLNNASAGLSPIVHFLRPQVCRRHPRRIYCKHLWLAPPSKLLYIESITLTVLSENKSLILIRLPHIAIFQFAFQNAHHGAHHHTSPAGGPECAIAHGYSSTIYFSRSFQESLLILAI